jgi:hypothetical protein
MTWQLVKDHHFWHEWHERKLVKNIAFDMNGMGSGQWRSIWHEWQGARSRALYITWMTWVLFKNVKFDMNDMRFRQQNRIGHEWHKFWSRTSNFTWMTWGLVKNVKFDMNDTRSGQTLPIWQDPTKHSGAKAVAQRSHSSLRLHCYNLSHKNSKLEWDILSENPGNRSRVGL